MNQLQLCIYIEKGNYSSGSFKHHQGMGFLKQILPYLNNWFVSFLGTEILLLEFLMQMFQGGDSDVSVY